jgi:hypothetical protein
MTELHSPDNELPVAIIGFPIPEPNTILRNDSWLEDHFRVGCHGGGRRMGVSWRSD